MLGFSLTLILSTVTLAMVWGGPDPAGSLPLGLVIALLSIFVGGGIAGLVSEIRPMLMGALVGLMAGGFVGLWPGSFPMKALFFEVPIWRVAGVPISAMAGLLGGWVAGRLIKPGGKLAKK